jgi:deoxyuridine 5'-triphosphate nucleotidohydrolase
LVAIDIHHSTIYRYNEPVTLGPHRLMVRPRESVDLRLLTFELMTEPVAKVTWATDVFGNAVATAVFSEPTTTLSIETKSTIELTAPVWPVFEIADSAVRYPFPYKDETWTDLGALTVQQYPDPDGVLQAWANGFVAGEGTDTLALLKDLSNGIFNGIQYQAREDEGTQAPTETLERKTGACRDFAVLFAEAARVLGFGARVVSGYIFNPKQTEVIPGTTHAWAEVYVPGAGWITFDPTNRIVGGANLIPVAVARDIHFAMPVAGSFNGATTAFMGLTVGVTVARSVAPPAIAQHRPVSHDPGMNIPIQVHRLPHADGLPLPTYATEGAAGMDLLAAVAENVTIAPGQRALIPTGLTIALPPGYELQIRPRSGLALRHGIVLPNSPGTIDEDYRGEVGVIVLNTGDASFVVERGMRIAQAVLAPVSRAVWQEVAALDTTARATGGFGSTGH